MDVKNVKTEELIPYEKNTKKYDKTQINNVAESIRQYGFVQPLVIDKNNVVVIGHCRMLAAKQLKMEEVPCVYVDDLTDEQVRALRIVDNKSNESPWDMDLLAEELEDLDLSDFDFKFKIQIEDIDDDVEGENKIAKELDEANNYVVLEFSKASEWDNAQVILGIEKVYTSDNNKNVRRFGIGRVIDGQNVIERILKNEN